MKHTDPAIQMPDMSPARAGTESLGQRLATLPSVEAYRTLPAEERRTVYRGAEQIVQMAAGLMRQIKETFDPLARRAAETHRAITRARAEHLDGPERLRREATARLVAYDQHEEELRRAREREALADQARRDEEERLAAALALEAAGATLDAEALLQEPPSPARVQPAQRDVERDSAAVQIRQGPWRAEITDVLGLARAVAAGEVPTRLIAPAQSAVTQWVRGLDGKVERYPWVRAWRTSVGAVRR